MRNVGALMTILQLVVTRQRSSQDPRRSAAMDARAHAEDDLKRTSRGYGERERARQADSHDVDGKAFGMLEALTEVDVDSRVPIGNERRTARGWSSRRFSPLPDGARDPGRR